nr:odorant receptor 26 [Pachyrhinus yasumatsui]
MDRGENLFKVTKWLMLVAGTWRLELARVPRGWQILYKIYSVLMQIAYYTCPISITVKFSELWRVDNDKAVECLSMVTIILLLVIKMALCQTKRMRALLKKAIEDVNTNTLVNDKYSNNIFSSYSRHTNILSICITIYSFSVGLHLNLLGCVEYYQLQQKYLNTTETFEKPIQVLYWYPFDINENYGFVVFYEFATILWTDLYNSAIQALFNTILTQLAVQLKILQHHVRNFTKDIIKGQELGHQLALNNIKVLVKRHNKIIMYIKDLNETLKYLVMIEYVVSSLMLAAILVQILSGKKVIFNIQYFLILAFQWCILSWNANEISLESQRISYSLYESRWYEQSKETKQIIFIMVLRCRKPLSLEIGPFGPLTNDAAVSRLKLAYSYVSLISG